jgi:hypothetical protein
VPVCGTRIALQGQDCGSEGCRPLHSNGIVSLEHYCEILVCSGIWICLQQQLLLKNVDVDVEGVGVAAASGCGGMLGGILAIIEVTCVYRSCSLVTAATSQKLFSISVGSARHEHSLNGPKSNYSEPAFHTMFNVALQ